MCVSRILEQWSALELYFANAAQRDRLVSAENIANALKNPFFKMYFLFLDYVLPKFTNFNKLFQSEGSNLHCLSQELVSLYKSLLSTSTYIRSQPLASIDPKSTAHMLPLNGMYMGHTLSSFLSKPEILAQKNEVIGFLEHCQQFYIEAASQIQSRFPINDPVISSLVVLNPDALSSTQCSAIVDIAKKFPNIVPNSDLQKLDDEWRTLSFTEIPIPTGSSSYTVSRFWGLVATLKDGSGSKKFPTVGSLIKSLLSLPHSNADVERIFSQVTLIKTKHRNNLKTSTMDAILMTKGSLPCDCVHYKPDLDMCKAMNSNMYDSDSADD